MWKSPDSAENTNLISVPQYLYIYKKLIVLHFPFGDRHDREMLAMQNIPYNGNNT